MPRGEHVATMSPQLQYHGLVSDKKLFAVFKNRVDGHGLVFTIRGSVPDHKNYAFYEKILKISISSICMGDEIPTWSWTTEITLFMKN